MSTQSLIHQLETYLGLYGLAAHRTTTVARELRLLDGRMHRAQAFKAFLELRGETLIGFDLRQEEGVATAVLRLVEDPEESCARWLALVRLSRCR